MKIKYGSVCSGVEAATLAWQSLGWEAQFFAEVEPFPSAVLIQRFNATKPKRPLLPEDAVSGKEAKERLTWIKEINRMPDGGIIPNLGDFTKIKKEDYNGRIDLLVGGTPCQSFSVAGNRKGLSGVSGLALEFIRLAYETGCRWVVWENVPGVFSTDRGRDFAAFLSGLTGQQIETPVDGWRTAGLVRNGRNDRFGGNGIGCSEELAYTPGVAVVNYYNHDIYCSDLRVLSIMLDFNVCPTIPATCYKGAPVVIQPDAMAEAHTVTVNSNHNYMPERKKSQCAFDSAIRRLTPLECERLMGFPDYHTRIKWRGKEEQDCPDNSRYKACGNSMCVNVMQWIGERIDTIERDIRNEK